MDKTEFKKELEEMTFKFEEALSELDWLFRRAGATGNLDMYLYRKIAAAVTNDYATLDPTLRGMLNKGDSELQKHFKDVDWSDEEDEE
jgi:hypothetical protein